MPEIRVHGKKIVFNVNKALYLVFKQRFLYIVLFLSIPQFAEYKNASCVSSRYTIFVLPYRSRPIYSC